MPALTHLQGERGCAWNAESNSDKDCGAAPVKITSPAWSPSSSQSALTVTSAMMNCRSDVKTIGAVLVSPFGCLRQRSVFGPAWRAKYSMYWGSSNVGGRLRDVNDDPRGGILFLSLSVSLSLQSPRGFFVDECNSLEISQ